MKIFAIDEDGNILASETVVDFPMERASKIEEGFWHILEELELVQCDMCERWFEDEALHEIKSDEIPSLLCDDCKKTSTH